MRRLSNPFTAPPANTSPFLTSRELQVLHWLAYGLSNKEIAAALCLSDKTVGTHMKSIFDKLSVHNRVLAVRVGQNLGLIIPNQEDSTRAGEREREREKSKREVINQAKIPYLGETNTLNRACEGA